MEIREASKVAPAPASASKASTVITGDEAADVASVNGK